MAAALTLLLARGTPPHRDWQQLGRHLVQRDEDRETIIKRARGGIVLAMPVFIAATVPGDRPRQRQGTGRDSYAPTTA